MAYHEHTDRRYLRNLRQGMPEAVKAFMAFDQGDLAGSGKVIPRKFTELMAVRVGLTTQRAHCIEAHVQAAKAAEASEAELAQTVVIATALRAGGGFAHGFMAMKFFEEAPESEPAASGEAASAALA